MCLVCSIRHWRGLCRLTQAGSWVGSWGVRHSSSYPGAVALGRPRCCCTWSMASMEAMAAGGSGTAHRTPVLLHLAGVYGIYGSYGSWGVRHSSSYPGAVALGRRLWHLWKLWQLGGQAQLIVPRCCCTWQASMAAMEAMAAGGSGTAHRTPVLLHLAGVYGIYGSYGSWGVRHSSSYPGAVALGRRLWHLWKLWQLGGQAQLIVPRCCCTWQASMASMLHLWKLWQLGGQAQLIVPRCCCTWQASMASMEAMAAGGSGTAHRTPVLLHLAGVYGIYGSYGSWGVRHSSSYPGAVALGRRLWHLWKLWQLGGQAQLIVPRCCCTWQASMASMEAMAAGGSGTAHRTPVLLHLAGVYGSYGSYGSWGVRHRGYCTSRGSHCTPVETGAGERRKPGKAEAGAGGSPERHSVLVRHSVLARHPAWAGH